jgi:hypothetical protein
MSKKFRNFIYILCFIFYSSSTFAISKLDCPPLQKVRQIQFTQGGYILNYDSWFFTKTILSDLTPWTVWYFANIYAKKLDEALILGQKAYSQLGSQMTDPVVIEGQCVYFNDQNQIVTAVLGFPDLNKNYFK